MTTATLERPQREAFFEDSGREMSRVDVPHTMRVSDHITLENFERSSVMNDLDRDWEYYNPVQNIMAKGRDLNNKTLLAEQFRIAAHHFPQSMGYPQQYMSKMDVAAGVLREALSGSRMGRAKFLEAISYDDFSYIMQDTIYRKMLGKYAVPRSPMERFSKEIKVPTMQRPGKMFTLDGIEVPLELVHPGEQPTLRYPYDSGIAVRPWKYMADVEILWETLLEDDLNALGDIPDRLNNAVQVTKGRLNTMLYADASGWRTGDGGPFNVANNDKILNPTLAGASAAGINNILEVNNNHGTAANAKLSLPAIQAIRSQISKFRSPDGNPIDVSLVHLIVGNGLEQSARALLRAQEFVVENSGAGGQQGTAGGQGFVRARLSPEIIGGIQLHVDPYLHTIVSNGEEDTMWMMVSDPNLARPMFAHCLLAGYETPFLARRVPQYRSIGSSGAGGGGNNIDWISTGFRIGFIYGTQWGDPRGAIASRGTG